MVAAVKAAAKEGDSLGGVAEVIAYGVPVGLGSHVHWDRRLDALLAQALMSIQAVKAVEFGDGAELAGRRGSVAHDAIRIADTPDDLGRREDGRRSAGATSATPTTPEVWRAASPPASPIVARVSMKPLATLNRPTLGTVDVVTKESTVSFKERTDVTAVPAMGVVAETMTALVLASEALRKFGGDSVTEFRRNRVGLPGRRWGRPPRPPHALLPMVDTDRPGGDDGGGQDHGGPAAGRAAGLGPLRLRRPGDGGHRPDGARALRRTGRGGLPGRGVAGPGRGPLRRPGRWWCPRPGGWSCRRTTGRCWPGRGTVVWLRADPQLLITAGGHGPGAPAPRRRPGRQTCSSCTRSVGPCTSRWPQMTVDVDGRSPAQVVDDDPGRHRLVPAAGRCRGSA